MAEMLVIFAAVMLFFASGLGFLWRRERRLARSRPNLEAEDFVRALPPSCDRMIGGWVYRQLDFHLPEYLKPHPSDHILSDLSIDPDDYSDMGRDHFERWSLPTPSPLDPEVLPEDPTVEAFVRYLTQRTKRS